MWRVPEEGTAVYSLRPESVPPPAAALDLPWSMPHLATGNMDEHMLVKPGMSQWQG